MRTYLKLALALLITTGLSSVQAVELTTGSAAPDFELQGADGKTYKLSDFRGKHVVLEWTNHGCPFVKKHYKNGDMQKLQETYGAKDVVWLAVCSSAPGKQGYCNTEEAGELVTEKDVKATAYLLDQDGSVGKQYGAKTTPHMYVIDPAGSLIYQGAIDSIKSTDADDVAKAENYVQLALDAALSGQPIAKQTTTPYGCSVKYQ